MSWIFACGLRFNGKSQPCIFSRWFVLCFPVKTYAKTLGSAFCSLLFNDKQKKPFVFPNNEISPVAACFLHTFLLENEVQTRGKRYRAVIFWAIGDHTQKFSSFGRKKKQTKIRHRMVMLRHLQYYCKMSGVVSKLNFFKMWHPIGCLSGPLPWLYRSFPLQLWLCRNNTTSCILGCMVYSVKL